jgi:hypothetical protein
MVKDLHYSSAVRNGNGSDALGFKTDAPSSPAVLNAAFRSA